MNHSNKISGTSIHPLMKELMSETFGVMVYQEDVIKVAHYFAGLSLTEADMLRRGMSGKYRGREEFKKVEKKFLKTVKPKATMIIQHRKYGGRLSHLPDMHLLKVIQHLMR